MTKGELLSTSVNLPQYIKMLIAEELHSPSFIKEDRSLRVKVTDRCGLTCVFCHNEGTPIASQVRTQSNLRVSIYENSNQCSFLPGTIKDDEAFIDSIISLKAKYNLTEIHWTGGEPMLNKNIVKLTKIATDIGLTVNMTSNGELGAKLIPSLADAGINSINYSIFGMTPKEFLITQSPCKQDAIFAKSKISKVMDAIDESIRRNIDVKANIVVTDQSDYKRVTGLIDSFGKSLKIRLLPNISKGNSSIIAIYELLSQLKAKPVSRQFIAGSSNYRSDFLTLEGLQIGFKQIDRVTLPETCSSCKFNNDKDCTEGFYGLRLYIDDLGNYLVGMCIQRMDLTIPLSTFLSHEISNEVESFKIKEYDRLSNILIGKKCKMK